MKAHGNSVPCDTALADGRATIPTSAVTWFVAVSIVANEDVRISGTCNERSKEPDRKEMGLSAALSANVALSVDDTPCVEERTASSLSAQTAGNTNSSELKISCQCWVHLPQNFPLSYASEGSWIQGLWGPVKWQKLVR